jgi:hypothetical protein
MCNMQTVGTLLGSTQFAVRYDRINVDCHSQDQCPSCLSHVFQSEMSVQLVICLSLAAFPCSTRKVAHLPLSCFKFEITDSVNV